MDTLIKEIAQKNIAKRLGVSNYTELVNADVKQERVIVAEASKRIKHRKISLPIYPSSGNPYVMLGLKVNAKGKRIK